MCFLFVASSASTIYLTRKTINSKISQKAAKSTKNTQLQTKRGHALIIIQITLYSSVLDLIRFNIRLNINALNVSALFQFADILLYFGKFGVFLSALLKSTVKTKSYWSKKREEDPSW